MESEPITRVAETSARRWVQALEIRALRGISGYLRIDLESEPGQGPRCLLVSGDNGTGKSSIVDAFQLALQAELQGLRGRAVAQAARSLGATELPWVRAEMADGQVIERAVLYGPGEPGEDLRLWPTEAAAGFEKMPLVLRRTDILRFWATPAEQRQLVFVRYFRAGPGRFLELPHELATRLNAERIRAKTHRTETVRFLTLKARVPVGLIPQQVGDFDHWVDDYFFGGRDHVTHRRRKSPRLAPSVRAALADARESIRTLAAAEKAYQHAKILAVDHIEGDSELAEVLAEATKDVNRAFFHISPNSPVEAFSLKIGSGSAVGLEIMAQLTNGVEVDPALVLSEANRDLMAFLIFVAIARAAAGKGQARVLILDDVFQSTDGPIRVAAMDWVFTELVGWQFVLTVHDRLWREQLATLLGRHQIRYVGQEITRWSLESGPTLRSSAGDPAGGLRRSLEQGDTVSIAMESGRLLENVCDTLSWTFEVSIRRKQGDRYTLGQLWPPVRKVLRKTSLSDLADSIDVHLHLRNLLGAHYNQWAEGTSLAETRRLGEGVISLFFAVYCTDCQHWISAVGSDAWSCRCSALQLRRS